MEDWKQDPIGAAERGTNPLLLARMRSGFAVLGEYQFIPGYALLLSTSQANHLGDLPYEQRAEFLLDMSLIGEALMIVCPALRINYEILGNTDPHLHAHVWPRYAWEPPEYRGGSVWRYPDEQRLAPIYAYTPQKYGDLKRSISSVLRHLMTQRGM